MVDYGWKGYIETKKILAKNGILHSGFGDNLNESSKPIILKNQKIVIIIAAEEEFGVSGVNQFGIFSFYGNKIIDLIKKYKNSNYCIIIFAHGGGEEIPLPSKYISARYKEFIDTGASLVIGHHPHVVQGKEKYKGGLIYYSLGNFIHASFDNYWGLILKVEVRNAKIIKTTEIPIRVNKQVINFENTKRWQFVCKLFNSNVKNDKLYNIQCLHMYNSYYDSYFKRVGEDKELLMHLIRNNSHRDFINQALKIITGEIEYKVNLKSKLLFKTFLKLILK
jgi:poly-gamma-glutamate synthesis protein (capsule biosynthesis protein)